MIDSANDPTDRIINDTQRMIDEANERRREYADREFVLPIARKGLRKRSRRTSVSHRAIR